MSDAPGGGGKIALTPEAVVDWNDNEIVLRNYEGNIYRYPNLNNADDRLSAFNPD